MIRFIRSTIFNLFFYLWTFFVALICLPLLALPPKYVVIAGRIWAHGIVIALRLFVGIKWQVRGLEYRPKNGAIIAAKHQSAFETVVFYLLCDMPAYVLKKELKRIPLFGWYISRVKAVAVNRSAGASALKDLIRQAQDRIDNNRQLIIFPEGTRVEYGKKSKYQAGIAAIYSRTGISVTPLALNSGKCWSKNSWIKKSGKITFEFLPPIEAGLKKSEFMKQLEKRIEEGCKRL